MQVNYAPFIDRMIHKYEGGYCWEKTDPGGPTKYGITCYDLAEFSHKKMDSMARWAPAVQSMPLSTAEGIYENKYAKGIRFADLPSGVDVVLLDYAVNSGVGRAGLVANRVVGLDGGKFTDELVARIKRVDPNKFVDLVCDERLRFMRSIRNGSMWVTYGRGWSARVADLRQYAHALAAGAIAQPAPDLSKVATPKATQVKKTAGTATTGTAVATGASAAAAGQKWWLVAVLVAVVVAVGIAYELYEEAKARKVLTTVHV